MTPTIDFVSEFALTLDDKEALSELLPLCFPETDYFGLYYFKQLPHSRLLMRDRDKLIGQVGIDYRMMNMNGALVSVWGVIDMVIHPDYQGKGLGTQLMQQFFEIAAGYRRNVDFILLVTDKPEFYEKLGYRQTSPKMTWAKLYKGKTHGIGNEQIRDSNMMYQEISGKAWQEGELDLMGYMY